MVWRLLKEVLKVGEATVPYPFVPGGYARIPRKASA
jgi:hypothetical protein